LSRDPLRIGLCPDRLILAVDRRDPRSARTEKEIILVESSPDSAQWQAAVDGLPSALALFGPAKPDVECILSNYFVRYALLPWNAALTTEAEWLALARHRLASVHGDATTVWALRVSKTGPNGPRIASATDQALIDALEATIAGCGAHLVSVQPYLMAAFNGVHATMGNSFWLVIEEPGRLTLALIVDGIWRVIRNHRVNAGWRSMLPEILERESAVLAIEQPCTRVVICTQEAFSTNMHGGFRFLRSVEVAKARDNVGVT
jgi:hypothetical protein